MAQTRHGATNQACTLSQRSRTAFPQRQPERLIFALLEGFGTALFHATNGQYGKRHQAKGQEAELQAQNAFDQPVYPSPLLELDRGAVGQHFGGALHDHRCGRKRTPTTASAPRRLRIFDHAL